MTETIELAPGRLLCVELILSPGVHAILVYVAEGVGPAGVHYPKAQRLPTPDEWTRYRPRVVALLDKHLWGRGLLDFHTEAGIPAAPRPDGSPAAAEVVQFVQSESLAPTEQPPETPPVE